MAPAVAPRCVSAVAVAPGEEEASVASWWCDVNFATQAVHVSLRRRRMEAAVCQMEGGGQQVTNISPFSITQDCLNINVHHYISFRKLIRILCNGCARLVERPLVTPEVCSSNLIMGVREYSTLN